MSLLDFYYDLASEVPEQRIEAARLLIKGLTEKDSQEDWDYALNRLIRGLSSSRGGARLGFTMALAEILELRKSKITIEDYYQKIGENFQLSSSIRGAEERGILFGQLFSLQTLAKSTLWQSATIAQWNEFVDLIIGVGMQKPWLREPAFFTLCSTIEGAPEEVLAHALEAVNRKDLALSCEGIALSLVCPKEKRATLNAQSTWSNGDPLHRKNITELARVLKMVPVGAKKTNNWKPDLHFVWARIAHELMAASPTHGEERPKKKSKKDKKRAKEPKPDEGNDQIELAAFWRIVVDEGLLSLASSSERKLWGYAVFNSWVKIVEDVKVLFTPNFVRTLSNQLAQSDRSLHKMAKMVVQTILEVARTGKAADFVAAILAENPSFDHTSKTKTLAELLNSAGDDIGIVVDMLLKIFRKASTFSERQWAINSITQLMKSRKNEDISWIGPVFDALIPYAYFDRAGDDEKLLELTQQRINSMLSIAINCPVEEKQSWSYYVFKGIKDYDGSAKLRVEFDDEIAHSLQRAEATLEKVHKKRMSSRHVDSPQLQAFELLFSMVLLQIYSSSAEAVTILDELLLCYNNIAGKARQQDTTEEEEEVDASQVLTEVLIGFLSQKSALLRKLSEDVWGSFSEKISAESLQLLFDIIVTKESFEGQSELFNIEDDEEMDEEDEEDDEESEEDQEGESDNENTGDAVSDEEDQKVEDDGNDDESGDGLDEKAREQLAMALGVGDSDSSEEESMDDEQMSALDGQLAAIFRERKNHVSTSKQEREKHQKARENMAALKSRVVDLLEIYVAKQPRNKLCLTIIAPLLSLMNITLDVNVGNKARELVRKICKTVNTEFGEDDLEDAFGILEFAQKTAQGAANKPLALACNQVAVYACKLILAHDKELIGRISDTYSEALKQWVLSPKDKTTANMFVDLVNFLAQKR